MARVNREAQRWLLSIERLRPHCDLGYALGRFPQCQFLAVGLSGPPVCQRPVPARPRNSQRLSQPRNPSLSAAVSPRHRPDRH